MDRAWNQGSVRTRSPPLSSPIPFRPAPSRRLAEHGWQPGLPFLRPKKTVSAGIPAETQEPEVGRASKERTAYPDHERNVGVAILYNPHDRRLSRNATTSTDLHRNFRCDLADLLERGPRPNVTKICSQVVCDPPCGPRTRPCRWTRIPTQRRTRLRGCRFRKRYVGSRSQSPAALPHTSTRPRCVHVAPGMMRNAGWPAKMLPSEALIWPPDHSSTR